MRTAASAELSTMSVLKTIWVSVGEWLYGDRGLGMRLYFDHGRVALGVGGGGVGWFWLG